jgi:putative membrane protein
MSGSQSDDKPGGNGADKSPAGRPAAVPTQGRKPQVFSIGDPKIVVAPAAEPIEYEPPVPNAPTIQAEDGVRFPGQPDLQRGLRWGAILFSALTAAASIAAGLWFWRFVSVALERNDWIGWTVTALIAVAAVAGIVIVGREIVGFSRIGRLNRMRADLDTALRQQNVKTERDALMRLVALYNNRPELKWHLAKFSDHARDSHDAGGLAALADREVMAAIDSSAKTVVAAAAKRVATVTALSPLAVLSVGFVLIENLRMMRALATLYGGRPGVSGSVRLARQVVTNLIAAGSVALTDDLLGQFVGQDIVRRLSRRLGEGVFNGALTGRAGVAAIAIIRPLPYIEASPIRVRDVVSGLLKSTPAPSRQGAP